MSGPQGSDPNPWQVSGTDQPATGADPSYPAAPSWQPQEYPGTDAPAWGQPGTEAPVWGQPPAYNPQQYPQYGQPPVPGYPPTQAYGAPAEYNPAAYGQPAAEGATTKSNRTTAIILGSLAALLLAAVLVLGFWKPGFFVTTKLDVNKAQQGVQQILTDEANGYGAKNVSDVKCNNGQNPTVKKGDTFTCEVSIDGTKRQVTVTFQDDKGTYEVGRPK